MTKLQFNKKKHVYTYGDRELMSVTKWVSSFFPEFDAKMISKRVAFYRRTHGELNAKGKPITAFDVRREWKQATEYGTKVHDQIEQHLKGKDIDLLPEATAGLEILKSYLFSFNEGTEYTIHPEMQIFSVDLGLAGTMDCPVFINGDKLAILDWKCVKKMTPDKLKKYELQLSTYAYIMEYETLLNIKALILVQLVDGDAKVYDLTYQKEKVQQMLEEKNGKEN